MSEFNKTLTMNTKQLIPSDKIIKKSNALARARWSAESVWEPRLVALLASKVRAKDTDFHVYEIPVSEILQSAGGSDYREIETVVDKVMSRVLTIRDDKGWTKYNVFSRCRYRKKDGILELGFHPDLRPHYLNLKKHFAQYNLLEYLTLPSIYSQRIFEILKSWQSQKEVILKLSELHEMLDTPESFRQDFRNFRLRVLEKAYKDIHSKTSFKFNWEPIKKGRAVAEIRFVFSSGAIKKIKENEDDARKKKQSQKNNEMVLKAYRCSEEKGGGICLKPTCGKKQAEICRKNFQR